MKRSCNADTSTVNKRETIPTHRAAAMVVQSSWLSSRHGCPAAMVASRHGCPATMVVQPPWLSSRHGCPLSSGRRQWRLRFQNGTGCIVAWPWTYGSEEIILLKKREKNRLQVVFPIRLVCTFRHLRSEMNWYRSISIYLRGRCGIWCEIFAPLLQNPTDAEAVFH